MKTEKIYIAYIWHNTVRKTWYANVCKVYADVDHGDMFTDVPDVEEAEQGWRFANMIPYTSAGEAIAKTRECVADLQKRGVYEIPEGRMGYERTEAYIE